MVELEHQFELKLSEVLDFLVWAYRKGREDVVNSMMETNKAVKDKDLREVFLQLIIDQHKGMPS